MDQLIPARRSLTAYLASWCEKGLLSLRGYQRQRKIIAFCILFVLYTAGAILSHQVYDFISPALIWPPAGVALAILFLEGADLWPAVLLASFVASLIQGVPLGVSAGLALGNTIGVLVSVWALRKLNFTPLLSSLNDVLSLMVVSLLGSMISPTIGVLTLWAAGAPQELLSHIWGPWWLGRMLSNLVVGTLVMRWFIRWPNPRSVKDLIIWVASFGLLGISCFFVFWTPYTHVGQVQLIYLVLIPLIWMALTIGPRAVTLALFLMTFISISGVLFGQADIGGVLSTTSERLQQIEVFDTMLTIIFLIFVSSEEGRKLASRALQEHIIQLENALTRISSEDRAKNEFLAILAHELRNPLAPILSSLELMRIHGTDPKEAEALLNTMDDRVRTMARLLDDLLDISRISQKKFRLQKESVDLNTILERSAETAAVLMQNKNHTLIVSLLPEPTWIQGDPVRLEQVVINLLNNAAKYTEPGGTISLFAKKSDGYIDIHIKDTGMGIPRDMLGRIFEPFLQVEQARRSEGLGIGLSLAKRLIEMHQGSISATSEGLGRGSEFVVRLPAPAVVQLPMQLGGKARRKKPEVKSPLTIFLVDDNRPAAEGLGKLLRHKGHTVTLAFDGAEALESAKNLHPDVVILDIGLPDMDGYALVRKLKESGLEAFFIALTGYGQDEDKLKARQAGFDHHLTKPVGLTDIEYVLAQVKPKQRMIAS